MTTPALELATHYDLDEAGRLVRTREPNGQRPPLFTLIRTRNAVAWAIRNDVSSPLADELRTLLTDEPPLADFHALPKHADRYCELGMPNTGPAFEFPEDIAFPDGVVTIDDEGPLHANFRGWIAGEIAEGRAPVFAIVVDGSPVSVCFCARSAGAAAAAGVDTAEAYRRRGYAARVTAAWAHAIRESGRVPMYSTSWTNTASLGVARKLGLVLSAANYSIE